MFDLKNVLSDLFSNQDMPLTKCSYDDLNVDTLGNAVKIVSDSMPHGVFTNTIILALTQRVSIPLESVLYFILPGPNQPRLPMGDFMMNLDKAHLKMNHLKDPMSYIRCKRMMSLIKSDGTLFIIERYMDM